MLLQMILEPGGAQQNLQADVLDEARLLLDRVVNASAGFSEADVRLEVVGTTEGAAALTSWLEFERMRAWVEVRLAVRWLRCVWRAPPDLRSQRARLRMSSAWNAIHPLAWRARAKLLVVARALGQLDSVASACRGELSLAALPAVVYACGCGGARTHARTHALF